MGQRASRSISVLAIKIWSIFFNNWKTYLLSLIFLISAFSVFRWLHYNSKQKSSIILGSLLRNDSLVSNSYSLAKSISDLEHLKFINCAIIKESTFDKKAFYDSRSNKYCMRNFILRSLFEVDISLTAINGLKYDVTYQLPINWQTVSLELMSYLLILAFTIIYIRINKEKELKLLMAESLFNQSKQVSHDIRSPLSVLNAIAGTMVDMPEENRILLRSAANRINDIANQLLQKNKTEELTKAQRIDTLGNETIETQGVSAALSTELLSSLVDIMVSEKRIQFREKASIVIEADLEESYGAFAAIDSIEFKRVLSNLINNSVEALKKENGKVIVSVKNYPSKKLVAVRDNGSGIPPHILEKLGEKGITHGKEGTESGSGLGIYHAKKTIESFGGTFTIRSQEGFGTEIRMEFPNCETPSWFVPEIALKQGQTVVALDDDQSVLEVWKQRFGGLKAPVSIIAFTSGNEFNNWIESNSEITAQAIFLMDYELIGQRFTGLDLIEENKLSDRAILVTSRYEEPQIRKRCEKLGVRLIPKGMAGYMSLEVLPVNV